MKTWEKPQLIVLLRNKPEEAVLYACKNWGLSGANSDASDCKERSGIYCMFSCSPLSAS